MPASVWIDWDVVWVDWSDAVWAEPGLVSFLGVIIDPVIESAVPIRVLKSATVNREIEQH